MIQLAAPMALAALIASFLAAVRLLLRRDGKIARRYVFVTGPFLLYVFVHSLAALMPFLPHAFWAGSGLPLASLPPWFIACSAPFLVNRLLKFEGFEIPEATGPLSRFRDEIRRELEERMIAAEFIAMRDYLAPFTKGRHLGMVVQQILDSIPAQWPPEKADALRRELPAAKTVEAAMELFVRHVDKKIFRYVFSEPQVAQLSLFERVA